MAITSEAERNRRLNFVYNGIEKGIIDLQSDCTDTNIHFYYKTIEITSELNMPNTFFIDSDTGENDGVFRKINIHLDLTSYLDEFDNEDTIEEDDEEEYDDEFTDRLKANFPGMFVDKYTLNGFARAGSKIPLLNALFDIEEDNMYAFASINGLCIGSKITSFNAPSRDMSSEECIFWCCVLIDRILNFFNNDDEEAIEYDDNEEE